MGRITSEMVHYFYEIGKKVYTGEIGRNEGKLEIYRNTNMDLGSANDYITVLMAMLDGKEYHRTINAYATEYYLEKIGQEFGYERQRSAAIAPQMHTEYYATLGHGHQVKIENLIKKYLT